MKRIKALVEELHVVLGQLSKNTMSDHRRLWCLQAIGSSHGILDDIQEAAERGEARLSTACESWSLLELARDDETGGFVVTCSSGGASWVAGELIQYHDSWIPIMGGSGRFALGAPSCWSLALESILDSPQTKAFHAAALEPEIPGDTVETMTVTRRG